MFITDHDRSIFFHIMRVIDVVYLSAWFASPAEVPESLAALPPNGGRRSSLVLTARVQVRYFAGWDLRIKISLGICRFLRLPLGNIIISLFVLRMALFHSSLKQIYSIVLIALFFCHIQSCDGHWDIIMSSSRWRKPIPLVVH